MSWSNCSRCGKAYTRISGGREICTLCLKEEEDNYSKIFHFLSSRPGATAQEISQETGVDLKEIYCYVRENRLRLVKTDTGFTCEACGIPISHGKICEICNKKLSEEIKKDINKNIQKAQKRPENPNKSTDPNYLKNYRDNINRN